MLQIKIALCIARHIWAKRDLSSDNSSRSVESDKSTHTWLSLCVISSWYLCLLFVCVHTLPGYISNMVWIQPKCVELNAKKSRFKTEKKSRRRREWQKKKKTARQRAENKEWNNNRAKNQWIDFCCFHMKPLDYHKSEARSCDRARVECCPILCGWYCVCTR